jgi:hypothetical protein
MKNSRLQKFEKPVEFEPSPEQVAQAREAAVNMIMAVYDRMPKDNIQPVADSFESLARQAKEGVPRQSTIIRTSESDTKIVSVSAEKKGSEIVTLHNSGDSERKGSEIVTKFDLSELEILRKIENGES